MKIEFKDILPPPPKREVIISLSVEDAKKLHNELYTLKQASPAEYYTINRLINALTEAGVQHT